MPAISDREPAGEGDSHAHRWRSRRRRWTHAASRRPGRAWWHGHALIALALAIPAGAEETVLSNPTARICQDEVVRLLSPAPAGVFTVREDGMPVSCQVEEIDGRRWIWVCSSFMPGQSHRYVVGDGAADMKPTAPRVKLVREGDQYLLDNGLIAVRVPASGGSGAGAPGPIGGVRLPGGAWIGASSWVAATAPVAFTATVIGDGTVLAKVRLSYRFPGKAGASGDVDSFAEVDVALAPGWSHVEVTERHEMARGDRWQIDLAKGWAPRTGISRPFSGGAGSGESGKPPPATRELKPGALPFCRDDLFINLFPRWNQHYKDGWLFAASDGVNAAGALVVKAGRWIWPHQNAIEAVVKAGGDSAVLLLPTWKGARTWWLMAGSRAAAGEVADEYVARFAFENLDKLNHDFFLDWPGKAGVFGGEFFYSGNINPTGVMRGRGRAAVANAGKPGDYRLFTSTQVMFHPDMYGTYWNFWSPENPNFFTDFMRVPIAQTASLKESPHFKELARLAELRFREDLYHSVTMPGGAGQECPGYLAHALEAWKSMAPLCKQHLGFDPTAWERYAAAERFLERLSQPDGAIRRFLPIGDTHPGKDGPNPIVVPAERVAAFASEELPGFGAVLQNRPGTPRETYLAFKSGPNRGHYHGDQLSVHWCADAAPVAVDHHCSYHPRAGQEHMHNRLAFSTSDFPYANMDGYERVIGFKTSADADIAIGQVESERLRQVRELPPEDWDAEYPQHSFAKPLIYRRTVVLVKNGARDYLVLRDQFWASEPIDATFCLHVLASSVAQHGQAIEFGPCTLFCAAPAAPRFVSFPWEHSNGGLERTQGARLSITADHGEFISVLYPGTLTGAAAIPGGVKVGDDEIVFSGDQPAAGGQAVLATVRRRGAALITITGADLDLDRSQGEIGLFVPDAGYPFGEIPDWLVRQRAKRPAWAAGGALVPTSVTP